VRPSCAEEECETPLERARSSPSFTADTDDVLVEPGFSDDFTDSLDAAVDGTGAHDKARSG
jgi:hypothetical protein